ncbi:MAG: tetratricopeptide repeat protein [Chloroflexi bacterium]|nr:tetratricopeptide repeat protein [Chloroflexota bacterium]
MAFWKRREVEIVEKRTEYVDLEQEVIPLNNCGGTTEVTITTGRGHSVQHLTEVQDSTGLGVGMQFLTAALEKHYTRGVATSQDAVKTLELRALSGENREFTIAWRQVWRVGEVGIKGKLKTTYRYLERLDCELVKSFDLGCGGDYLKEGHKYRQEKKWREAIEAYTRVIRRAPDNAEAYKWRAAAYGGLGNRDQAVADYTKAIELDPNPTLYHWRGNAYRGLRDYDRTIIDYTKALELAPSNAHIYFDRGEVYYHRLGNYERAIVDYNKAIAIKPSHDYFYYGRGSYYYALEDYDQALADFNKAIDLNPNLDIVYHYRGMLYQKLGKKEKAIADFLRHLELENRPYWREETKKRLLELGVSL